MLGVELPSVASRNKAEVVALHKHVHACASGTAKDYQKEFRVNERKDGLRLTSLIQGNFAVKIRCQNSVNA